MGGKRAPKGLAKWTFLSQKAEKLDFVILSAPAATARKRGPGDHKARPKPDRKLARKKKRKRSQNGAKMGSQMEPKMVRNPKMASRDPPEADFLRKWPTFTKPWYLRYFSQVRPSLGTPCWPLLAPKTGQKAFQRGLKKSVKKGHLKNIKQ